MMSDLSTASAFTPTEWTRGAAEISRSPPPILERSRPFGIVPVTDFNTKGDFMTIRSLAIALAATAIPLAVHAQEATNTIPTDTRAAAPIGEAPLMPGATATRPAVTGDAAADMAAARQAAVDPRSAETFVTVPAVGTWRVTDLEGSPVYGAEGEHIGEINDVLVNEQGQVAAVIIGVGGFLGIGEKDVAVSMGALAFGPGEPSRQDIRNNAAVREAAPAAQGDRAGAGRTAVESAPASESGAPAVRGEAPAIGDDGLPNRIVLGVTRDQLEDAPEFKGVQTRNEQG